MSTLTEIEAAAAKLPRREQRQLHAFITKQLKLAATAKAEIEDPLAGIRAHRERMLALTGGQPMLTQKEWKRLAKALGGK
jgi:hypothetical protein